MEKKKIKIIITAMRALINHFLRHHMTTVLASFPYSFFSFLFFSLFFFVCVCALCIRCDAYMKKGNESEKKEIKREKERRGK